MNAKNNKRVFSQVEFEPRMRHLLLCLRFTNQPQLVAILRLL